MKVNDKIFIAGHKGMVGSAIWRILTAKGYSNLIGASSNEIDLRNQQSVIDFILKEMKSIFQPLRKVAPNHFSTFEKGCAQFIILSIQIL